MENMTWPQKSRMSTAADHAKRRVFPHSAIGELISRELLSQHEFGYFGDDSLMDRVTTEVMRLQEMGFEMPDLTKGVSNA